MDLLQLRYFVRVAELGSFTRAASVLGVAQPALSRQIRLLEVELHQTLLRRTGRGAVPTEAGNLLLEHGRGILHQVDRTLEEMAQARGGLAGRVALGLTPSVARVLAVPLMQTFRAEMPQARLMIREGLSISMLDYLLAGQLDVAVLYNASSMPGLEITPLANEELLLVRRADGASLRRIPDAFSDANASSDADATSNADANADHDADADHVTLAELSRLPLIIPSQPNAIRMHVEATLATAGLRPNVTMEVDGVRAILDLVADGAGNAILSRQSVESAPRPGAFDVRHIRTLDTPVLLIPLFIAVSALRPATRTQLAVLALVRQLATERIRSA